MGERDKRGEKRERVGGVNIEEKLFYAPEASQRGAPNSFSTARLSRHRMGTILASFQHGTGKELNYLFCQLALASIHEAKRKTNVIFFSHT